MPFSFSDLLLTLPLMALADSLQRLREFTSTLPLSELRARPNEKQFLIFFEYIKVHWASANYV